MPGGASLELLLPLGTRKQVLKLEAPGGAQGAGPFQPLEGACTLRAPGGWVTASKLLIVGGLWGVSEPQKYCSAWKWCLTPFVPPPPVCCSDVAAVSSSISQTSSNPTTAGMTLGTADPSQSPGTLACCDEQQRGSPSCPSVCSQVCLPGAWGCLWPPPWMVSFLGKRTCLWHICHVRLSALQAWLGPALMGAHHIRWTCVPTGCRLLASCWVRCWW